MRVLVVGSGGREHAIAWAIGRRGHTVLAAPGNPGIAEVATCHAVPASDNGGLVALAVREKIDLVVVGPEAPLAAGLGDAVRAAGIACFGPGAGGARLEASKAWAKRFFARHHIPTPEFAVCASLDEVDAALARLGDQVVVKADGLAAGKGVIVCHGAAEARAAAEKMLAGAFGEAGKTLVVEKRIDGREASVLALTDGKRFVILPPAEDHKAVFDDDQGPNTGGMGAVSPTPVVTLELFERVARDVLVPTVEGLRAEGIDYRGVLYAGVMVGPDGAPQVLEYNCRFGDPETEAIFVRWADDPTPWLAGVAAGELPPGEPRWSPEVAVCVVMAAAGYPGTPHAGDAIEGLADGAATAHVFQAGTRRDGDALVTAGGRVLAVTALGRDLTDARARAYGAVAQIHFNGAHFRRDIGGRR